MAALALPAVLLTLGAAGAAPAGKAAAPDLRHGREYVCPMSEHRQVFDHPGKCPVCGTELVPRTARVKVAILVFDYVQIIDFTAPYEIFGEAGFDVFTVGPTREPVTTVMGMKVTPAYDFAGAPPADVLVLPGGVAPEALVKRIADQVEARWHWTSAGPTRSAAGATTHGWTFKDERGRPWQASLRLTAGHRAGELEATFEWSRIGAPPLPS